MSQRTGTDGKKSAPKSAAKAASGQPFAKGQDPRRGRGPKAGAPNAGRPPAAIQALARESWASRLGKLEGLIDNAETDPRVVVAAMAELRNGSGLNRIEVGGETLTPDERQVRLLAILALAAERAAAAEGTAT